jgi:orotate phosphoribosyltransferase
MKDAAWRRVVGVTSDEVLELLESVGAVRHGHFVLSSGRHSDTYVQCALVLACPRHAERLGRALAARFRALSPGSVVSLALGGIVLGQEVARALGVRSLFVERDASGRLVLRRGFELGPGEKVLVIEDVWTTGGSTREAIAVIEEAGGRVVAAGALVDRSGGKLALPVPTAALATIEIPSYDRAECPLCRSGAPVTQPGSRFVRSPSRHV